MIFFSGHFPCSPKQIESKSVYYRRMFQAHLRYRKRKPVRIDNFYGSEEVRLPPNRARSCIYKRNLTCRRNILSSRLKSSKMFQDEIYEKRTPIKAFCTLLSAENEVVKYVSYENAIGEYTYIYIYIFFIEKPRKTASAQHRKSV